MLARFAIASILVAGASAMAAPITYTAFLNGANENPSVITPATGYASVIIDATAHTMQVFISFSGLTSGNTAAHIHCCIAAPGNVGVATPTPTFPGFPGGTTTGSYTQTFDLTQASSYRSGFVTAAGSVSAAEAQLIAGMAAGQAYLNIHTSNNPGGEIRGFFSEVPEPSTWTMSAGALALAAAFARRKRN
jgi:hypothetical protein